MLTMKDIIQDGHPTLRQVAQDVPMPPSKEDQEILHSLLEYVQNSQDSEIAKKYGLRPGIGLAAPQINVSKKMLAVHVHDLDGKLYSYELFNPKIKRHSVEGAYLTIGEGCLSVKDTIPGFVPRHYRITVEAQDIDGNDVTIRLKGFPAIVMQHEIDHLNGVMFYDHISKTDPLKPIENAVPIQR